MRTTLALDDALFRLLEHTAAKNNLTFKEVVNSTLRRGLAAQQPAHAASTPRVVVKPFTGGLLPDIDANRMNQLNDELEVKRFSKRQPATDRGDDLPDIKRIGSKAF